MRMAKRLGAILGLSKIAILPTLHTQPTVWRPCARESHIYENKSKIFVVNAVAVLSDKPVHAPKECSQLDLPNRKKRLMGNYVLFVCFVPAKGSVN